MVKCTPRGFWSSRERSQAQTRLSVPLHLFLLTSPRATDVLCRVASVSVPITHRLSRNGRERWGLANVISTLPSATSGAERAVTAEVTLPATAILPTR